MGRFKDYGTDEWDDIMVRQVPNIERIVDSLGFVLEQARERFAPGSPYLEQIKEQYELAVLALRRHKEIIAQFRQQGTTNGCGNK